MEHRPSIQETLDPVQKGRVYGWRWARAIAWHQRWPPDGDTIGLGEVLGRTCPVSRLTASSNDNFRVANNPDGFRIWLPRTSYLESFRPIERLQDADELAKPRTLPGNR